ncbi:hypothetical protein AMJ71_10785, partial [candidate division TA06 bacterium SM1_40]
MFERTYGGSAWDVGSSVGRTDDGGYIVAGETYSFGSGGADVYLIKTDGLGDTLWTRTYGGSQDDISYSVEQTGDGGYIIAGYTDSFGAGEEDVYLVKTDGAGDTVWTRAFGGPEPDFGNSVEATDDGGCIVIGITSSFGAGSYDFYLIKTDGAGDTLWTQTFGGSEYDYGSSVKQTSDGGYVVAGHVNSFGVGSEDIYLIKLDAAGDTLWTRTYGGSGPDGGRSVEQTDDGGYIIAGDTRSFGAGVWDVYLIKTDAVGDTSWTRAFGGLDDEQAYSVDQTEDGGYILAGYTKSFGAGQEDVYLIRTDAAGDTLWTRTFGGSDIDYSYSVQATDDGGYIIAGRTRSFGAGNADVYLIKTDANGYVQVSGDRYEIPRSRYLYLSQNRPNPFGSSTTISYSLAAAAQVRLAVYDIRGARVRELASGTAPAGSHQVAWDGRDERGRKVGSGIYFCRLEAGERSATRRMVLLR